MVYALSVRQPGYLNTVTSSALDPLAFASLSLDRFALIVDIHFYL